jgi:hypothetical protein
MLVRRLAAALAVSVTLLAGCGGGDDSTGSRTATSAVKGSTQKLFGQWIGNLTQAGLPPFRVAAAIFSGAGKVAYTGIDCAGDWKLQSGGDSTGSYVFTETINTGAGGKCKGTGTVHLDELPSKRLRYRFEGGGVTSRGILRHARNAQWVRIFEEAGVQVNDSSPAPCPKGSHVCASTVTGD